MTKERKLAIEMWQGIRDMLFARDNMPGFSIPAYKREFCVKRGLKWTYDCWFCKYIRCCSKCPLNACNRFSHYDNVVNDSLDKDARVSACNAIIKALGGEV